MDKKIIQIHGAIQYFEAIGSWGMAQALRRILASMVVAASVVVSTACSSIPSLGPGDVTKVWHVHPDDRARFEVDRRHCFDVAAVSRGDERLVDSCLQRIGYRLEITKN